MSDEQNHTSFGFCSSLYTIAQFSFCILSIVWYAKYVVNDHGQYGPEYSYIISWFYKIGIYCIISLSTSMVTIIIAFVSMCTESFNCLFVWCVAVIMLGYCVCCWLLAEGVAVNNTFDYPCTHMPEFNITTMMSGNGTHVCDFYNDEFSTLFIFYTVLFSFNTLTILFLCITGCCYYTVCLNNN